MPKVGFLFIGLLFTLAAAIGCAQPSLPEQKPPEEAAAPESVVPPEDNNTGFSITSPAFIDGTNIPVKYTCNGQNMSPALTWGQGPAGTASFALILEDPDAPLKNFTHWVIFNLPPDIQGLSEAITREGTLTSGALQGKNGGGSIGYFGPCPPKATPHHYRFTLYALDRSLDLNAGATKDQVRQAMEGHILGEAQLIGIYQR